MSVFGQDRSSDEVRTSFFGVIKDSRTYRSIVYLLLGLPLGTLYFTILVTGISVGASMMVVALVGIPILIGLWYVVRALMSFERGLAVGFLGEDIAAPAATPTWTGGLWQQFKALTRDRPTLAGAWYLFLRFPAGIATFTIAVTLISVSLGLAFAPTWMWTSDDITWGSQTFDPFPWSFALVPIGVILVFVSLHAMNRLAAVCGRWTRFSLGGGRARATGPTDGGQIDLRDDHQDIRSQPAAEEASARI